jgi:hypothetical protein
MKENGHDFIMKVAKSVNLRPIPNSHLSDGSYLSIIRGKMEDRSVSTNGRKKWNKVEVVVRVIVFQIPGFPPVRLITSILESNITAKEIVIHYHKRWDIEITYDEIKTHQCATLRGQSQTNLRSKRADFIEQELFSVLIVYNLIRSIIVISAEAQGSDPLSISFLDSLQIIIEGGPFISGNSEPCIVNDLIAYMFKMIANSPIDRPRRNRCNPRVVKVKMSNFNCKRRNDKSVYRDFEADIQIIAQEAA